VLESSISERPSDAQRLSATLDPAWRRGLGAELRRRRMARGLTQQDLGRPLSKAFVSAVERGRAVPSLPALLLMVDRLDVSLADFFAAVDEQSNVT
jgi:transcriptional regulator with XRE-family HTH domain